MPPVPDFEPADFEQMHDTPAGERLIEAHATIVAVEAGSVTVETQRAGGCAACSAAKGCGTAAVNAMIGPSGHRLRLRSDIDLAVGDAVVLTVPEGGLVLAAALAYLLPLVGIFGATLGVALAGGSESQTMIAAGLGLAAGLVAARWLAAAPGLLARLLPIRIRH